MDKMLSKKFKNGVAIERISDHKQIGNASFDTQESEIQKRAEQEGFRIVKFFKDVAKSAYHQNVTQREAMINLVNYVLDDKNDVEGIFFYDESRLSRQFYDFVLHIYKSIKDNKPHVKFYSALDDGEWNPDKLKTVINFATAAQQSIDKSTRAIDGQKTALAKKERPGSDAPFGYKLIYPEVKDERKRPKAVLVVDKHEAAIVRKIFYLTSWGHSQDSIVDLLNKAAIPSPEGKEWQSGTIDYILNNDSYLGHLPWNVRTHRNKSRQKQRGEYDLIPKHHESIINVTLWFLAHQSIELHKQNGRNNSTRFYLRGILFCKNCNKKLTSKNDTPKKDIAKKEYLVYRCSSCKGKVNMEDIHSEILNNLSESWPFKVVQMAERIQTVLKRQKKEIIDYRNKLIQDLELVTFRENYLISQFQKVTEKADWDFVLSISKSRLKKDLSKVNQFIEHLNLLEENAQPSLIYSLLGKFALNNLNQVELRTLFLSLYKKINIDFVSGNLVYVNLKFAPFAEIEIYYDEFIKTGT